MGNDCLCYVRVGGDPETIYKLADYEFSFSYLHPPPQDLQGSELADWLNQNWGTDKVASDYRVLQQGRRGIDARFTTNWMPPRGILKKIVEDHHDAWIKCEWTEEGGWAGVYLVSWDPVHEEVKVQDYVWEDWPLEEIMHRMNPEYTPPSDGEA